MRAPDPIVWNRIYQDGEPHAMRQEMLTGKRLPHARA